MLQYVLKRLLSTIPVLLGISLLLFFMLRMLPGDPAQVLAGQMAISGGYQDHPSTARSRQADLRSVRDSSSADWQGLIWAGLPGPRILSLRRSGHDSRIRCCLLWQPLPLPASSVFRPELFRLCDPIPGSTTYLLRWPFLAFPCPSSGLG